MKKKIHYQSDVLERFIPISLERLVSDLVTSNLLPSDVSGAFDLLCQHYIALYHAKSHSHLNHLKKMYLPFNPDREVLISKVDEPEQQLIQFKSELIDILEKANFERLSPEDLNAALNKISPHGVRVSVDFGAFSEVALFYRGSATHTEERRNITKLQFRKKEVKTDIYRRLFVLLQPKNKQERIDELVIERKMSREKAEKKVTAAFDSLGLSGDEEVVYMKLFKDIPTADLEMLFPNTRVRMKLFDKIKLAVMGGGGTAGGVMATITKFSAAIEPMSAVIAVGGLLGVIWRQIAKFFSQRAKYSAILTKNLYFYSLDNNMGALTHLIDTAAMEECKEAILAYFFLLIDGESNREALDKRIETYIYETYAIPMDFEIDDGLAKLQKTGLLAQLEPSLKALSLPEANLQLQKAWHSIIEG